MGTRRRPSTNRTRRTVLAGIGGCATGLATRVSTAAGRPSSTDGSPDPGGGLTPATIERPQQDAHCVFINATDRNVDIYVNYGDEPWTNLGPDEDGPVFSVDSEGSGIYGTYTFEARETGQPDDQPLAAASVGFREGDSYTAVFHEVGTEAYELSIYDNDFSPSASTRLEVHHNAVPQRIDWRIAPKQEADPRIPVDERSGSLERGQYQQALDVVENEYRFEVLVDGDVVAFRQDLELEANRMIVCYVVGDPRPWMGSDVMEGHVRRDEFQIQTGEKRPDVVTEPTGPLSSTDTNRAIVFDWDPLELYETNVTETEIGATDPDGIVADLTVDDVTPSSDGFSIPDETVDRADAIGLATTGSVRVRAKVPPDSYEVTVIANRETMGEQGTCVLPVTVKPVTVERLRDLVERYHAAGDIADRFATDLHGYLDDAAAHLAADETGAACTDLEQVHALVGEHKAEGVSESAAVDIETEGKAFRERLGCG